MTNSLSYGAYGVHCNHLLFFAPLTKVLFVTHVTSNSACSLNSTALFFEVHSSNRLRSFLSSVNNKTINVLIAPEVTPSTTGSRPTTASQVTTRLTTTEPPPSAATLFYRFMSRVLIGGKG
eukprot:m.85009 g.85009  ORF g.85009 m.85009 type:complete len:121 (-) comp12767_c1_seq6:817-1179(-)